MCKFSTVVQYISTIHPHKRDGLLKAFSEDENDDAIFHDSMFTYYESRPKYKFDEEKDEEYWEKLSLGEFVAQFDHVYGKPSQAEIERRALIKLENNKGFINPIVSGQFLRYGPKFCYVILKSIDEKKVNSNPWSQSDFYDGTLSAPPPDFKCYLRRRV